MAGVKTPVLVLSQLCLPCLQVSGEDQPTEHAQDRHQGSDRDVHEDGKDTGRQPPPTATVSHPNGAGAQAQTETYVVK